MSEKPLDPKIEILLVEDNPNDVELALHAFKRHKVANHIKVARDGAEALDYIFCTGEYAERDIHRRPKIILLDLKLPKVDGMEVLKRIKSDPRTKSNLLWGLHLVDSDMAPPAVPQEVVYHAPGMGRPIRPNCPKNTTATQRFHFLWPRRIPWRSRRPTSPSETRSCISRNSFRARGTWSSRCSPTNTATPFTSVNATALSSAASRSCSRNRPVPP